MSPTSGYPLFKFINIINYIISSLKFSVLINSFYVLFVKNILLKDIKMLEPVINSSYCLTISWRTFM